MDNKPLSVADKTAIRLELLKMAIEDRLDEPEKVVPIADQWYKFVMDENK